MATEFLGIKPSDIVNCTKNFGTTIGISLTSAAVAVTVDFVLSSLAIKVFKVEKDSSILTGISFVAFAAGCATTFYLAPQMSLISFAAQKVFTLIAIDAALIGIVYFALYPASRVLHLNHVPSKTESLIHLAAWTLPVGGLAGYIGGKAFIVTGIMGAAWGLYGPTTN